MSQIYPTRSCLILRHASVIAVSERVDVNNHVRLIEFQAVISRPKMAAFVDEVGDDTVHLVTILRLSELEA